MPPSLEELASTTKEIDAIKGNLIDGDSLKYISPDNDPIDFDLSIFWTNEELENMVIRETTEFKDMLMNLIVKKARLSRRIEMGVSSWY